MKKENMHEPVSRPVSRVEMVRALSGAKRRCDRLSKEGNDAVLGFSPGQQLSRDDHLQLVQTLHVMGVALQRVGVAIRQIDIDLPALCNCEFTLKYLGYINVNTLAEFLRQERAKLSRTLLAAEADLGAARQYHLHALAFHAKPSRAFGSETLEVARAA